MSGETSSVVALQMCAIYGLPASRADSSRIGTTHPDTPTRVARRQRSIQGSQTMKGELRVFDTSIQRKKLGRTDMFVTRLSLGCVGIGGGRTTRADDATAIQTFSHALDRGMNYADTSPLYGESERRIGLALKQIGGRPTGLFISTKCGTHPRYRGDYSAAATRWTVENSLRVMGVDSVDILFIQTPSAYLASLEPVLTSGGTLDELERMRDEGKFRWIGLAIREHDMIRTAARTGRIDVILTFGGFNLIRQTAASLLAEARERGIGTVLGFVYMAGLLSGEDPAERVKKPGSIPDRLFPLHLVARDWWLWARQRGVPIRSVALQYGMRNADVDCVLVGCSTPSQVDDAFAAASEPLPDGIWDEVDYRIRRQND
jgi:aryl-alcohol dehydrogenase-like predicted oxidoreductase